MSDQARYYAFPLEHPHSTSHQGMTLRDYFAAKALQGLIAQPYMTETNNNGHLAAEYAYRMADEMLKAREQ
jgi:hypothetical protein